MTDGQLSLWNGREIQRFMLVVRGSLGDMPVDLEAEDWTPDDGDEIEVTLKLMVEEVGHRETVDKLGVGTEPLTHRIYVKALTPGFAITNIRTRAERRATDASLQSVVG